MGTNYHWHERPTPCRECGHDKSRVLHIGKSSFGWVFLLHTDSEEGLNTLEDWQHLWTTPGSKILSEYGTLIPIDQMNDIILDRQNTTTEPWGPRKMAANQAISGPFGLLRGIYHHLPPNDETYDLVPDEFS